RPGQPRTRRLRHPTPTGAQTNPLTPTVSMKTIPPLFTFILSALCLLCLCGVTRAGGDQELKSPYQLRVVLHFAEHRALTPLFQQEVESELGDQLRLTFGPLANVEILYKHPLLKEVQAKGLQHALDSWNELSDFS